MTNMPSRQQAWPPRKARTASTQGDFMVSLTQSGCSPSMVHASASTWRCAVQGHCERREKACVCAASALLRGRWVLIKWTA